METTNKLVSMQVDEIELVYRRKIKAKDRPAIDGARKAYEVLMAHWDESKLELLEQTKVLLLNRANKVLGIIDLATGGITGAVMDTRLILAAALKACATGVILAHNHPSESLKPSSADLALTRKIKEAASYMDIALYDHLIMSAHGYYSFADEGDL
ncbi:JAB domain-containing protein [Chitinophaga sp. S165]|uniref:JAB domain-containing protein n=1 Tax=Chitinophaga sp. S165 TaxID=2135462 RepID=UPI000D716FEB|nr:JAB domain-containing protein [Chitinophaga sp. S165]PWV47061.1 RadC-like JAB domain-containing protein [Chitinophaga sp. S165]